MPAQLRYETKYPGVYYVMGTAVATGKPEKIYYIRYRKNGKLIEEKAGRQYQDDMTAARAAQHRVRRIEGKEPTNKEKREDQEAEKKARESKWTVDRLWKEYVKQNPDLKGLRPDKNRYERYIEPQFGSKEPQDIAPLDADRLRLKILKGKSPQTVKHVLALLRRIINFGVRKRLCSSLSFSIEMPKVDNKKTEDLTAEELQKLVEAIEKDDDPQAGNIMKMALFTGMRRGEIFRLRWEDIDFNRGFIHIRDPKGAVSQKIPMNDMACGLLQGITGEGKGYIFPAKGGKQRTDIHHKVNKIRDDAGLPKEFRALHGLRHVYASMLASSGQVDMYTLQKLLTHKSPMMTQRYAHLRDEAIKRASDLAGSIIDQVVSGNKSESVDASVEK